MGQRPLRYTFAVATQDILNAISRRAILAAGIGLIVILIVATVVVLAVLRNDALERAEWYVGNLATALSQQTWQAVHTLEILGKTTVDELKDRYTGKRSYSDSELLGRMRERIAALPSARMLAFVDPRGDLVLHSPVPPERVVGFADRDHFQAHLKRRIEGLYIGAPVFGRLAPEWLNVFSCRVEDEGGRFRGVLFLAVGTTYFNNLFEAFNFGEGGRVFLFRDDGVLLAVHPPADKQLGRSFAQDPLFKLGLATAGAGVQRRAGLLDDEPRVVAFERVTGYPAVVAVTSRENFILAQWRRDAWQIGAGAAGAVTFIGIALFFLMRQVRVSAGLQHDLREASQRLRGIIHSAMDAIITVDERHHVVLFNEAAEKIFRCPAAEAIGGPLERFIPERFHAAHRGHIERFGKTGETTRAMGARLELYGLRADGEEFPIDASISQIAADGKKFYTVILRDITRRKQAEEALARSHEELRQLSSVLHEAREAERLRVARELHDELAQWLTAIKMDVSWLASRLPQDPPQLAARVEKLKGAVDTTVASVRRIASDLRPVMLDDLGLAAALEGLLHEMSQRTGIVVSLEAADGTLDFGEPLASSLYRMAQEALTNVARHAEASEVEVTVVVGDDDRLVLTVRDNGKGYDEVVAARRKSYGVLGIRERAYTLGGTARIERIETGGTLVEIVIPVARYRRRGAGHDTGAAG